MIMSETMKNSKTISFLIANSGASQMSFYLINELNKFFSKDSQIDPIVYYEDRHRNCVPPNFSMMQISEAWFQPGPIIATSISTAKSLIEFTSPEKFFYVWDLEWIRNTPAQSVQYENFKDVYTNKSLKLIARSQSHKKLIENCFNRDVDYTVENFNMQQITRIVNE